MDRKRVPRAEVERFITRHVSQHPRDIARLTARQFGITRQAAHGHLSRLVRIGTLEARGETKSREYRLTVTEGGSVLPITPLLEEHRVWEDTVLPHLADAPRSVRDICNYGVTEMVNNAIDHSGAPDVALGVERSAVQITLMVSDRGIGVFRKIKEAYALDDERHAVLELTKGKLTTDPARHTGEGIFFTSRMFDEFWLGSGNLWLGHTRDAEDWLIQRRGDATEGTTVLMRIDPESPHTTREVFDRYASEQDNYGFTRTHVIVALAESAGEGLVSRSQAKRLLMRLDRFRDVVLDFRGVESIGPGFADEIFRIFARQHPDTHITPVGMNQEVMRMVRRVRSPAGDPAQ